MNWHKARLITFQEWRTWPFSPVRWIVYAVEAVLGIIIVWRTETAWSAWAGVGVILAADYLWTCWQAAIASDETIGQLGRDDR